MHSTDRSERTEKKEMLTPKGQFFDYSMLILVLFLVGFGLVMIYSSSSYSAMLTSNDPAFYFKKQLKATILGLAVMVFMIFFDYHRLYKMKWFIYILALISVLLVMTPLGIEVNGARRWIGIKGFSVQPAEFVKLAVIIALAGFVTYSGNKMKRFRNNAAFCIITAVAALAIMVITENMSTAVIICLIAYVMLMVGNSKPKWLIVATACAVVLGAVFLIVFFKYVDTLTAEGTMPKNFRFRRLIAWRNPQAYASNVGFQTLQSLYALGSGGFFGKGRGQSMQKLGFIPEAQNDMVFSIICEELGAFGGICLILLFILLIWRFMVIADNAPDLFGSMLCVGVMAHIGSQVILNIAVATNAVPNTGITLPFISYGGTSVLFLMAEMGMVLNVSRQIRVPVTENKIVRNARPQRATR